MPSTPQKSGGARRPAARAHVSVTLPSPTQARDGELSPEPRVHKRRSSVVLAWWLSDKRLTLQRRVQALCVATVLLTHLVCATVFFWGRHVPGLSVDGVPPPDEQVCCGPPPCALPFRPPVVKASPRDVTRLEAMTCAWLPDEEGYQVTLVWSDEARLLRNAPTPRALLPP